MSEADSWIDGLAEGVVLIEGDRVVRINESAARLLGTDRAWAQGKRTIAVLRDHRLERALRFEETVEVRLAGRLVEAAPLPGGLALRDVTEARRAREEADALLATLSHELRTPMTTVRSTLEALEVGELEPQQRRRLLERAIEEADRVVRLLADLTTEVAPPRERSVRLTELLARAQQILATTLGEREVRLSDEVGEVVVWADPDKVLQVLLNLIENAALHGPAGGRVEVVADERPPWVRLAVRDGGEPLGEGSQVLAALLSPRRTPASREHGLGLYVVRSIAEGWGGEAWWREWREGERCGNEFGVLVPGSRDAARQRAEGARQREAE